MCCMAAEARTTWLSLDKRTVSKKTGIYPAISAMWERVRTWLLWDSLKEVCVAPLLIRGVLSLPWSMMPDCNHYLQ